VQPVSSAISSGSSESSDASISSDSSSERSFATSERQKPEVEIFVQTLIAKNANDSFWNLVGSAERSVLFTDDWADNLRETANDIWIESSLEPLCLDTYGYDLLLHFNTHTEAYELPMTSDPDVFPLLVRPIVIWFGNFFHNVLDSRFGPQRVDVDEFASFVQERIAMAERGEVIDEFVANLKSSSNVAIPSVIQMTFPAKAAGESSGSQSDFITARIRAHESLRKARKQVSQIKEHRTRITIRVRFGGTPALPPTPQTLGNGMIGL